MAGINVKIFYMNTVRLRPMNVLKTFINNSNYQIRILLGSLFAAIVADGVITRHLVHSGLAREGNPFLQYWVVEDKLLSIKILGGLLAVFALWNIYRRKPIVSYIISAVFLFCYIAIICWNVLIVM
jgi:Domain of unknown function (DUF5658)